MWLQVFDDHFYPESQLIWSSIYVRSRGNVNSIYHYTSFSLILFDFVRKISSSPQLRSIITFFHEIMQSVGESSLSFTIQIDIKQVCTLVSILFGILISMLLSFVFRQAEEGVYTYTQETVNYSTWTAWGQRPKCVQYSSDKCWWCSSDHTQWTWSPKVD